MQTDAFHATRHLHPRPDAPSILHQSWTNLAFLHWPVEPRFVKPLLPRTLDLETFDGMAWIGMTPFRVTRMRPALFPAVPVVGDSLELNLRTYVRHGDVPGIWFFTLEASNPLAVFSARYGFRLPYHLASMDFSIRRQDRRFRSRRVHPGARAASFEASWTVGDPLPLTRPGTLDHFLIERYWLYTADGDRLWRARIHHERWPLRRAWANSVQSTLFAAHGLPSPHEEPLMHAQREPLHVEVWPLRRAN